MGCRRDDVGTTAGVPQISRRLIALHEESAASSHKATFVVKVGGRKLTLFLPRAKPGDEAHAPVPLPCGPRVSRFVSAEGKAMPRQPSNRATGAARRALQT
jgi:hypothetical protein